MKLVTRYILKQLLVPFFVALFLFTTVLLFVELFHLTELVVNKGVPFSGILLVLATQIPETFPFTVPMSLILAVVMTYGRLSHDNEITALRMAGCSLHGLIVPPLVIGLVLAVLLVGMNQFGLPQLVNYKNETLSRLKLVNPMGLLKPKTYLEIPPYTLYAEEIDGKIMRQVWIEDRSQSTPQVILSQTGTLVKDEGGSYRLVLSNGTVHQKGSDRNYRVAQFEQQSIPFQPGQNSQHSNNTTSARTLMEQYRTYRKLSENLKQQGDDAMTDARKDFLAHATDFHRTLALPFATFFLVFLTAPAGMLTKDYGKIVDLVICLGTFLVYYLGLSLMEPLATTGYLTPGLAIWLPNFFFGLAGLATIVYLKRVGG